MIDKENDAASAIQSEEKEEVMVEMEKSTKVEKRHKRGT